MERNDFLTQYAERFVVDHLHWNGKYAKLIDSKTMWEAYCKCDGFGKMSRQWHDSYGFDWSHVRDSKPETFIEVADFIAGKLWYHRSIAALVDHIIADCARVGLSLEDYLAA